MSSRPDVTETIERLESHLAANGVDLAQAKPTLGPVLTLLPGEERFASSSEYDIGAFAKRPGARRRPACPTWSRRRSREREGASRKATPAARGLAVRPAGAFQTARGSRMTGAATSTTARRSP